MKTSHILIACVVFAVLGDVFLLSNNHRDEDQWENYRDTHGCKPLSATDKSNRAGYVCDDGEVRYRWRQMR